MTATEAPALLPMTTFLIANDVPREHRTAACAAFGLWLEQFGEGNAPLALLHLAEALKQEQENAAALADAVGRVEALCFAVENRMMATAKPSEIRSALSGGVV
jgi:precorrin isomerase